MSQIKSFYINQDYCATTFVADTKIQSLITTNDKLFSDVHSMNFIEMMVKVRIISQGHIGQGHSNATCWRSSVV